MAAVSLDLEAIGQLGGERKILLDTIDSLRKHGVGRLVDLPQIIVVGDQSSGKSSVLEAISRVRFPVKDGLCTRFATELVLRTGSQTRIDVQVQRASGSTDSPYIFNQGGFDKEELPRIVEEAKAHMLHGSSSFSEDILRVEICSPDVPHLTLVDLPGFYHAEDDSQSAEGRKVVDRLAETYMARKNTIILAIVSARNQVVLQKVLSKVKGHDAQQERTLGIITKPDLLLPNSQDEDNFLRLAKNREKSHTLALGWHVLRNRNETESSLSSEDRDAAEQEFFGSGIWSVIPASNRGVSTLRKKLANILLDHIRKNLDNLIKDIENNLQSRMKALDCLGPPRSSPPELRGYLDKIASQFQLLCLRAIEGNYSDEFFGDLFPDGRSISDNERVRKLRAIVRDLNRTFSYVLATKGSRRVIVYDDIDELSGEEIETAQETSLPSHWHVLESQYQFDEPEKVTRDEIRAELEPLSSVNQGTEFPGTTNDLIAVKFFQNQSRPWEAIARFHIGLMLRIAKLFVDKLVKHITGPDVAARSAILSNIVDPFFEKRTASLEVKLQELLYHFQNGHPQPPDMEFRELLRKRQQRYLTPEILFNLVSTRPELFTEKGKKTLAGFGAAEVKSDFDVGSLIDKAETYYELSLRNFTDNVIILAVENCLIKELPTILTTSDVSKMDDGVLNKLVAESADTRIEREQLKAECEALQKGLRLCKNYKNRNSTVLPSYLDELNDIPGTHSFVPRDETLGRRPTTYSFTPLPSISGVRDQVRGPSPSPAIVPSVPVAPAATTSESLDPDTNPVSGGTNSVERPTKSKEKSGNTNGPTISPWAQPRNTNTAQSASGPAVSPWAQPSKTNTAQSTPGSNAATDSGAGSAFGSGSAHNLPLPTDLPPNVASMFEAAYLKGVESAYTKMNSERSTFGSLSTAAAGGLFGSSFGSKPYNRDELLRPYEIPTGTSEPRFGYGLFGNRPNENSTSGSIPSLFGTGTTPTGTSEPRYGYGLFGNRPTEASTSGSIPSEFDKPTKPTETSGSRSGPSVFDKPTKPTETPGPTPKFPEAVPTVSDSDDDASETTSVASN